jgi:ATP-dependent exoDNAse (exonuclease V) beta subunit
VACRFHPFRGDFARLAASPKQSRAGAAGEIAQAVKEAAADLALLAAQDAVRPYEQALIDLVRVFTERYASARREANLLDFEDLQAHVVDLFARRPDIAARYHAQFSSVMIDEFQDTNAMQIRLVDSLAPQGFAAVGDERQSIYRFRHADVNIFARRAERSAISHTLRTNYRSHPDLVRFFNGFFGRAPFWPDDFMRLEAGRDDTGESSPFSDRRVTALLIDDEWCGDSKDADEARIVAAHVRELVDNGVDPGDIVILLRAMTVAETFAGALRDAGVEVFVASGGTYFSRPEVIDLEMLLRVISNTKDNEALLHVLAGPLTGLSDDALARLGTRARRESLWSACLEPDATASPEDADNLSRLVDVVGWFRTDGARTGLAEMIHAACEGLEYDLTLFARGFDGARAWANVLKLARIAEEFEQSNAGDPQAFLEYLDLKRELEGRETLAAFAAEDVDAVRIMSVHAAKGLEFPVTIVANLGRRPVARSGIVLSTIGGVAFLGMKLRVGQSGEESLPTTGYRIAQQREADADLAEEKRLFYVACTRAREALVVCGRTAFSKAAESPKLVGWLREALGFAAADSIAEGAVCLGDSTVNVLTPRPAESGPVGVARPPIEPEVLRTAAIANRGTQPARMAEIERISYSGISLHRKCPYRFYVTNVIRMGRRTPETTGNDDAVALGTAVHALLKVSGGMVSSLAPGRIDEICDAAGLPLAMRPEAVSLVRSFESSETGRRMAACLRTVRERPFAVVVGETVLDGFIDVIGWEGESALIVDYKTGDPLRQRDPEEYRTQAECYAIAALALGAARVEVRFFELKEGGREIPFCFTREDSDELMSRYTSEIDAIRAGPYRPLEKYSPYACPECPALGSLCPVSSPPSRSSG